jgi:hypothetical protein
MSFSHSPRIVTDGLVLCLDAANSLSYPGSGTAWTDLSGNGNNGTLVNGPTFSSGNGGSIVFDGVDDYVDFGNVLFNNINAVTISVWVNIQSFRNNNSIISKGAQGEGTNSTFSAWIVSNTTTIRNRFYNSEGTPAFVSTPSLIVNTWYNLVWTYDSTLAAGYSNGILYGTSVLTGSLKTNTNPLRIARDIYGNNSLLTCSNLQIYNRSLSAQEVLQNFTAVKNRFEIR